MNYYMHPPGKPNAGRWYSQEGHDAIRKHKWGKKLIVAKIEEGFGGFKHPKPILPPEAKAKVEKVEPIAAPKKKPEATPEPLKKEGETE